MRRFAWAFFSIFLIGLSAIWLAIVKDPKHFFGYEAGIWDAKMQLLEQCDSRLAIISDSLPWAGVIARRLGEGVLNMAWGATTPVEGFVIAKRVLECPTPPQAVILSYSLIHFRIDDFWGRAGYFGYPTFADYENLRHYSHISRDYGIIGSDPAGWDIELILKELGYVMRFPLYLIPSLRALLTSQNDSYSIGFKEGTTLYGTFPPALNSGTPDIWNEAKFDHFSPLFFAEYYLNQTIDLLASRHIEVYFLAMPWKDISIQAMTPGLADEFTAYLHGYELRYPNFHVIRPVFSGLPISMFRSDEHMNVVGAKWFTDQLRDKLNALHVPGAPYTPAPDEVDECTPKQPQ